MIPDNSSEFIRWLFQNRCVGLDEPCYRHGSDISHIIPRSRGEESLEWKNLCLQCRICHGEYHRRGISDEAIANLQTRRAEFLTSIGREDYI